MANVLEFPDLVYKNGKAAPAFEVSTAPHFHCARAGLMKSSRHSGRI